MGEGELVRFATHRRSVLAQRFDEASLTNWDRIAEIIRGEGNVDSANPLVRSLLHDLPIDRLQHGFCLAVQDSYHQPIPPIHRPGYHQEAVARQTGFLFGKPLLHPVQPLPVLFGLLRAGYSSPRSSRTGR